MTEAVIIKKPVSRYHKETRPLICRANQWTGFYMITASVMKELSQFQLLYASSQLIIIELLLAIYL